MNLKNGAFTVSLDFELYWGLLDKCSIEQYKDNLLGVKKAVHEILYVFKENKIHATWATVGFLFFSDQEELKNYLPRYMPHVLNRNSLPYQYIESEKLDNEYHFAPELIELIHNHDGQEIGTHTFSHYYCLEEGQSKADFTEDISAAITTATSSGISTKSLIFPRNQTNPQYLAVLEELGIQCYRGNGSSWMYRPGSTNTTLIKCQKLARLLDTYLNISGHNTYDLRACATQRPFNFSSSRFLRPFSKKLSLLDGLRLKRITKAMDDAAINNRIFHLWWHPHNFGVNTRHNIKFLKKILDHYTSLNQSHGMKSFNMGELSSLFEIPND